MKRKKLIKELKTHKWALALLLGLILLPLTIFLIKDVWLKPEEQETQLQLETDFFRNGVPVTLEGGSELTTIELEGEKITGITEMNFKVKVKNTANVTLDAKISEATPEALAEAFGFEIKTLEPGEEVVFETGLLETLQFEEFCPSGSAADCGEVEFTVVVKEEYTCPLGKVCKEADGTVVGPGEQGFLTLTGQLIYNMQPDETGVGSELEFVSSTETEETLVTEDEPTTTTTPTATGDLCDQRCREWYGKVGFCRETCEAGERFNGVQDCGDLRCCCKEVCGGKTFTQCSYVEECEWQGDLTLGTCVLKT